MMWFNPLCANMDKEKFVKKMGEAHPHLLSKLPEIWEKLNEEANNKRVVRGRKRKVED